MICPKCGSTNVTSQTVTETTTKGKTKGFGCVLFGPEEDAEEIPSPTPLTNEISK